MTKREELIKAVDDAYTKALEADEAHDQALTALEYYEDQLKEKAMSCPLHSNDNSCAGCAKVKIQRLERQLAEAREEIMDLNKLIIHHAEWLNKQADHEFSAIYTGARCELLNKFEQLKEKGE